ncbi:MAG: polysaccharide biosynthesis protein, partial [Burkholderiales bacterium PBB5]
IGLIQLAGYAAGYLMVGLPMALNGWGAQSLAAAAVVQAGVVAAASFAVHPHSLKPLLAHALGRETLETGRTVFSTNLVNWLLSNLDRALMGRALNTQAVGLYSVAFNLASIPTTLLVNAMQPTFLAAGARLQNEPKQLAAAWMSVLACVLVLLLPFSMVCAMLAPDLIALLYGAAWSEAGWLLAVLLLCVPAWGCLSLSTPVLWNTGRKHLEVRLQLPLLALAVPTW